MPIQPAHLAHYLAACKVAGVRARSDAGQHLRGLIERLAAMSIPAAVRLLRARGDHTACTDEYPCHECNSCFHRHNRLEKMGQ